MGLNPLSSIMALRYFHTLIPNALYYGHLGDQYAAIVNAQEEGPCHALHSVDGRTICQLVAQKLEGPNSGMLVAANDPRKDMKDDLLCYRSMVPLFWCRIDNLLQALRYVAQFGSLRYRRCSDKSGVHHALNPDPYSGVFGSDREKYARDVEDLITFGTLGRVAGFISEAIKEWVELLNWPQVTSLPYTSVLRK